MSPNGELSSNDSAPLSLRLAPADPSVEPLFRPVVDLDSGAVLAVEAAERDGSATRAACAERLVRLARAAAREESLLPLILPVPARAVTADDDTVARVESELRRCGRRPREVTLMLDAPTLEVDRGRLLRGIGHVRELGFRCAFATAKVPPDLLLAVSPFLYRIDADLVAGVPGDERLTTAVEGIARIGRGASMFPLAFGVSSPEQLARLRRIGVRLAQGPLFADERWRPGVRVPSLPETPLSDLDPVDGHRVMEFMAPAVTLPESALAEEVLATFTNDTALNSVILLDHRERPVAALDRSRFLLAITGPYGHALHAKRPARRLADTPRTVSRAVPAIMALRSAGADRERVYDDLVVVNEFGQCVGTVRVSDLIRGLANT